MEINPLDIAQQTTEQLTKLLEATAEKTRLEQQRIALEQEKINNQNKLIEKEEAHNNLLNEIVEVCNTMNTILQNAVVETLGELRIKIADIHQIQHLLAMFLLREYEKLEKMNQEAGGDENKYKDMMNLLIKIIESKNKIIVNNNADNRNTNVDTVNSNNDTNIGDMK